jgi:hypothetical protein
VHRWKSAARYSKRPRYSGDEEILIDRRRTPLAAAMTLATPTASRPARNAGA